MSARLIGVGVGPGDPDLITVKALRALEQADAVFVPVDDVGTTGRAESIVTHHLPDCAPIRLPFAMSSDPEARQAGWRAAGERIVAEVGAGLTGAFATIGDPNVYSTFTYIAETVADLLSGIEIETVAGITAMQELAARSNTVLVEGNESLALFPLTAGVDGLRRALDVFDTVVCYKGGRRLPAVLEVAEAAGQLDGAVYGAYLGLADELICPAREMAGSEGPYLSTVILPPKRGIRPPGGVR